MGSNIFFCLGLPYGNPYGNHISISYVTNFDLEPYGSHMEVIWKSQTKKKCYKARSGSIWNPYGNPYGNHISMSYVTNFDLEPYGSHMEVLKPQKWLLGSFWKHMEPIWKSIWKLYFHVLCHYLQSGTIWKSYGSPKAPKMVTRL